MLKVGEKAPINIKAKTSEGVDTTIKDLLKKYTVVYFYPKDNTPGCTTEACGFRDYNDALKKLGVEVIGVSKDTVKSHQNFIQKQQLNFVILSDTSLNLIKAFGAWGDKKFMGRSYKGIIRSTFLLNEDGKVIKVWEKVNTKTHAKEVFDYINLLQ